jgi:hypothetical protein
MVLSSRQRAQIHPSSVLSGFHANINGMSTNGNNNGNGIISATSSGKMRNDSNSKPAYVIFSEIVQTSNTYLRTCTRIEKEWIEEVANEFDFLNHNNNNNH